MKASSLLWIVIGLFGYCLLPWYILDDGLLSLEWLFDGYPFDTDYAPALFLIVQSEKLWLAPILLFLLFPLVGELFTRKLGTDAARARRRANVLLMSGIAGLAYVALQGYGIGLRGWNIDALASLFGPLDDRQFGMGSGALLVIAAFLFYLTTGIAGRGAVNGDVFVVGAIGLVVAMVSVFIFFPLVQMLSSALRDNDGVYSLGIFAAKFFDNKIWGLGCLTALWCCVELVVSGGAGRIFYHSIGVGICAGGNALRLSLRPGLTRAYGSAHHHTTVCNWSCHHPIIWPVRFCHAVRCRSIRPSAHTLDIRIARHFHCTGVVVYTYRFSCADRCGGRRQPLDGGGGADPAGQ